MKKLLKIEEFLNKKLIWIYEILKGLFLSVVPKNKIESFIKTKDKISNKITVSKDKIINFFKNFKEKFVSFIAKSKIEFRERLRGTFKKIDDLKKLRIKDIDVKEIAIGKGTYFKLKVLEVYSNVRFKFKEVGFKNIAIASSLVLLFVVVLSQIYVRSKRMFIDAGIMRGPASVSSAYNYPDLRPSYYKKDEKHLLIRSIRFPVYVGSKQSSRSVTVDLTVTTSNKYIRAYLDEKHYLVSDIFNTKIEPIVPSFPLEEEGKIILKEKIKKEINLLLKELKIEGEIEDVHIHAITAS